MKKILFTMLSLTALNAFAVESSYRLTSKNILEVSSEPAEACAKRPKTSLYQQAFHTTVITLKSGEVLNLRTIVEEGDFCKEVIRHANDKGRAITNALNSIVNEDITVVPMNENVICQKNVAYVLYDSETKIASSFQTKAVVTKCPR